MEERLKNIFSDIFEVESSEINEMSSAVNIERWDSLNHTNLVVALEEEFNVSFSPEEIIEMLNFKLIKIILEDKLGD